MNNNDISSRKIVELGKDFFLYKYNNDTTDMQKHIEEVRKEKIQIHFSLQSTNKVNFNNGRYSLDIARGNAMLLYNPNEELPINLDLAPKGKYIILLIEIDKFHAFFSQEAGLIHFLETENRNKKFYNNKELSPIENVVLNELFNCNLSSTLETLYSKGKVYELLSLFFHKKDEGDVDNCPFLKDENNVLKIQNAKKIIISKVDNPPTLSQLATMIDLPLKKLKEGFKQIYGDTVFNFLLNYKMELARNMMKAQNMNVTEISDKLGYSTASHFINAFKNKYGTTPKQYMMTL